MLYQSDEVGFLLCKLKLTEVGGEFSAISIQLPSIYQAVNMSKQKLQSRKKYFQWPTHAAQWIKAAWE
jgi:hypothetical protein